MASEKCILCQSQWGNHREKIHNEDLFFCCKLCAIKYKTILKEIKRLIGWETWDIITISGNHREKICKISRNHKSKYIKVNENGFGELIHI